MVMMGKEEEEEEEEEKGILGSGESAESESYCCGNQRYRFPLLIHPVPLIFSLLLFSCWSSSSTMTVPLDQSRAQELFEKNAFFLLDNLPRASELSIDGVSWLVDAQFRGFKLIPPGLHMIVWAAAPSSSIAAASQSAPEQGPSTIEEEEERARNRAELSAGAQPMGGAGVRNALLHWFAPREVVDRSYDASSEDIVAPSASSSATAPLSHVPLAAGTVPSTVISQDYLKTLDSQLAPYPFDALPAWKNATTHMGQDMRCIARVIGIDPATGDARTDALTEFSGSSTDDDGLGSRSDAGRTVWGTARTTDSTGVQFGPGPSEREEKPATQEVSTDADVEPTPEPAPGTTPVGEMPSLHFTPFDLRRSWPPKAFGEELTRYSIDKSWLLGHVVGLLKGGELRQFFHLQKQTR